MIDSNAIKTGTASHFSDTPIVYLANGTENKEEMFGHEKECEFWNNLRPRSLPENARLNVTLRFFPNSCLLKTIYYHKRH
jgi:hypothetical protein